MKLYVISDTHIQKRFSHLELARFAAQAEVDFFQYREKSFDYSTHYEELNDIAKLLKNSKTQLIINDDLELALNIKASGVHVGKEDIKLEKIFKYPLPSNFIVGATVHNEQELYDVQRYPVNYLGVGPIFGTHSKKMNIPPLGIDGLKFLRSKTSLPIYAIGNIQLYNFQEVLSIGVEGIVILSAFVLATNPLLVLNEFKKLI